MWWEEKAYEVNGSAYKVRSASERDAGELSELRVLIDGETENMDRERGEGVIDEEGFRRMIAADAANPRHLFLVAETDGRLAGFSRCEGSSLRRLAHKAEFGVCVAKAYWGLRMGQALLGESIAWADANGIKKMTLGVLETNVKAIKLYERMGFETEGVLKNDKRLSDGRYYNTVIMGRWRQD